MQSLVVLRVTLGQGDPPRPSRHLHLGVVRRRSSRGRHAAIPRRNTSPPPRDTKATSATTRSVLRSRLTGPPPCSCPHPCRRRLYRGCRVSARTLRQSRSDRAPSGVEAEFGGVYMAPSDPAPRDPTSTCWCARSPCRGWEHPTRRGPRWCGHRRRDGVVAAGIAPWSVERTHSRSGHL